MRGTRVVCAAVGAGLGLGAATPAQATFPGGNGRLTLAWSDGACARQIVTLRPDGSRPRPLTPCNRAGGPDVDSPDWAGDGRRLVFERDGMLVMTEPDGTGEVELQIEGRSPSFSPGGRRIAFVAPDRTIRIATRSGRVVRLLRKGFDPRWSPDGREIAYRTLRGIFVMDARSGRKLRLIGPRSASYFDWSPDGRRLLYTAYAPDLNVELWVLPTDGSGGARRLTRTAREEVAGVWSPDGRRIAVVREDRVSESVVYEVALITRTGRRTGTVARSSLRDSELTRPPRLSWRPLPR